MDLKQQKDIFSNVPKRRKLEPSNVSELNSRLLL